MCNVLSQKFLRQPQRQQNLIFFLLSVRGAILTKILDFEIASVLVEAQTQIAFPSFLSSLPNAFF